MSGRSQQYLRSEYIQPPPGPLTLDAKKSPLALLAKTCSAIGKDSTLNKTSNSIQSMCNGSRSPVSSPSSIKSKTELAEGKKTCKESPNNHSSESGKTNQFLNFNAKLMSRSPVNVADHFGAIINSKRQSPINREVSKEHEHESKKNSRPASATETKMRRMSSPAIKHRPSTDVEHGIKEEKRRRRSVHHAHSPKHESRKSPRVSSSPDKQESQRTPSAVTTIPPPHTSYLMSVKTPPLGQKQADTYPSVMPCTDRFCAGCQVPHLAGSCDINGLKSAAQTQNLLSLYSGLDPMTSNMNLAANGMSSSYALQSQFMLAALAARNEVPSAYDMSATPHMCNWVTAAEGTCGKRFATADELIEHLRTHALPSATPVDYFTNGLDKAYAAVGVNSLAYLNHPSLGFPGGVGSNISASNHLANVALANERFIQSNQRRNSPMYRYHPYKASPHASSYLPLMPPTSNPSGLYCSPYTFYGQPIVAPSTGYVFP